MAHQCREVLLDVDIVVVQNGLHEGGRHWLLHVYCSCLVCLALDTSCRVDDLYIVAWERFAGRSWFFGEGLEAEVIGEDWSSSLCLPVAVIDEFALEMVFDPLEGRYVTALPDKGDALEVGEVVLVDVSAF